MKAQNMWPQIHDNLKNAMFFFLDKEYLTLSCDRGKTFGSPPISAVKGIPNYTSVYFSPQMEETFLRGKYLILVMCSFLVPSSEANGARSQHRSGPYRSWFLSNLAALGSPPNTV